jgi:hypothetical protein
MEKRDRISILLLAILFTLITIGTSHADPKFTTGRFYDFELCWLTPKSKRSGFRTSNGVSLCCDKGHTRCVICLRKQSCQIITDKPSIRDSVLTGLIRDYRSALRLSKTPPKILTQPKKVIPGNAPTKVVPTKPKPKKRWPSKTGTMNTVPMKQYKMAPLAPTKDKPKTGPAIIKNRIQ